MTNLTAKPLAIVQRTAKPRAVRPLGASPTGVSLGSGADPIWRGAAGSSYLFTGSGSREFLGQYGGTGAPTYVNSGLLLPDSDGGFVAITTNTIPVSGARWSDGTPYDDNGSGITLNPYPFLYGAPDTTNSQPYSNDLTTGVWTASNVTVARDYTGLTGASNEGCTLTATAGNGTVIADAITASSDDQATQWFIQRKTGTGNIELTVDGGSTWTDITASVGAGVYGECVASKAATTNPSIGIRIVTSGDAVYVGNTGCILGRTAEKITNIAPIITAAAAVEVTAPTIVYDSGNFVDAGIGIYLEIKASAAINLIDGFLAITGTEFELDDGTTQVTNPWKDWQANEWIAIGFACQATDGLMAIGVEGLWSTNAAYDDTMLSGALDLFRTAAGVGNIRKLRIYI